jgi:hypothetical protein
MYTRLQTYRVDPCSRRRQGVFIASAVLLEESSLDPWLEEEIALLRRWFNHHLPVPPGRPSRTIGPFAGFVRRRTGM